MSFDAGAEASTEGTTFSKELKRTEAFEGTQRERLEISDEAIDKIIADVLGGADGLASIFAGEQNVGIFDSTVAAQAAGDLAANLVGEIAKLRAEKITEQESLTNITARESGKSRTTAASADVGFGFDFGL